MRAMVGRRDVMELMLNGVSFGGTFNGNLISLAAARATLDELSRDADRRYGTPTRSRPQSEGILHDRVPPLCPKSPFSREPSRVRGTCRSVMLKTTPISFQE
jgi:hypothetical protein